MNTPPNQTNTFCIHPDTVQEVKERADIYDVSSQRVTLKKPGQEYIGLCPFPEEKTPSFYVSTEKQRYYCFGCGTGGDTIEFLKKSDTSSFQEVILDLAERYQVPIKTESLEQSTKLQQHREERERIREILKLAANFYQHALRQPHGQEAREYLHNSRGLPEEIIQKFGIGYAPDGWVTIQEYLVTEKGFPPKLVEKAGLIARRKEGGYYDRFRNRIIIPIYDVQGRIIGFGPRSLNNENPKYINSPETELFKKGQTLFALHEAKETISGIDEAIVVEGYFDAISLHPAGITNVVASLGTALSKPQINQLSRFSKTIVLNFDSDKAGVQATRRAIHETGRLAFAGQIELRILQIPEGEDADTFLKNHPP